MPKSGAHRHGQACRPSLHSRHRPHALRALFSADEHPFGGVVHLFKLGTGLFTQRSAALSSALPAPWSTRPAPPRRGWSQRAAVDILDRASGIS